MEPSRVSAIGEAPPDLPASLEGALPFTRYLACVDGWRQHYLDVGQGPAVVLLHGSPVWSAIWRRVIPLLTGFRVIAPDLVGFGLSDKPLDPSLQHALAHGARTRALLDALGVEHAVLVGHEWGGPVAACVALQRPKRVAGLVLANSSVLPPATGRRVPHLNRLARSPVLSDLLYRFTDWPLARLDGLQAHRPLDPQLRALLRWPLRSALSRTAPLALARRVPSRPDDPAASAFQQLEVGLGQLVEPRQQAAARLPLALVWGQRDPLLGRALGAHLRAFPSAQVWRTDAGHFLQEEAPGALAEAIRACWKAACG